VKGLWAQNGPEDLATPEAFYRKSELVRKFYSMRQLMGGEVQPNPGHLALAEIEQCVPNYLAHYPECGWAAPACREQ